MTDEIDRYGLSAQFSFAVAGKSLTTLGQVVHQLQALESAAQAASTTIQRSGLTTRLTALTQAATPSQGKSMSSQVKQVANNIVPLRKEFRALRAEFRNLELPDDLYDDKQWRQAAQAVDQYTKSLEHLKTQIHGTTTEERELTAQLTSAQQAASQRQKMANLQRQGAIAGERLGIATGLQQAGAAVFQPLVSGGRDALVLLAEFDDQMSQVQAVSNASAKDMGILRQKAKDLGASTRFSASQAAEGLIFLAQAGYTAQEQLTAIDGTLNLAASGGLDLAAATDIAVSTLGGFQLAAKDAAHVADVLAFGAAAGNTDVQGLGEALKYAAPAAKAFGSDVEETVAAITLLSNAGIKGSQAGTSLRTGFLRLAAPTNKAQAAIAQFSKAIGHNLTVDESGNLRNMTSILQDMKGVLSGMGQADQIEAIKQIFGTEASSSFLYLIENSDKLGDLGAQAQKSSAGLGAAAKMAAVMEDNLGGSWRSFQSALEGAKLAFIEPLKPIARAILQVGTQILGWLSRLPAPIRSLISTGLMLTTVLGGIAIAVGTVGVALFTLQQASATAQLGLLSLQRSLIPLTGFFAPVSAAFTQGGILNVFRQLPTLAAALPAPLAKVALSLRLIGTASLSFMASPLGVATLALLGFYLLIRRATPGIKIFGSTLTMLAAPFTVLGGFLKGLGSGFDAAMTAMFGSEVLVYATAFQTALDGLIDQIQEMADGAEFAGEQMGTAIAGLFRPLVVMQGHTLGAIVAAWTMTAQAIINAVQPLVRFFTWLNDFILHALAEGSPGLTLSIREKWGMTLDWLGDRLHDFLAIVQAIGQAIQSVFVGAAHAIGATFNRAIAQPFQQAKHRISHALGPTGIENAQSEDAVDEVLAKRISYQVPKILDVNNTDPGIERYRKFLAEHQYEIERTISDAKTGFAAYTVRSLKDNTRKLIFTGTNDLRDVMDDATSDIGDTQFAANRDKIAAMLADAVKQSGGAIDVLGHSLGGALAQTAAVSFGSEIKSIKTYNSTGIGRDLLRQAEQQTELLPRTQHFIERDDFVSTGGDGFLPGDIKAFRSTQGWMSQMFGLASNHLDLMLDKPAEYQAVSLTLAELNDESYGMALTFRGLSQAVRFSVTVLGRLAMVAGSVIASLNTGIAALSSFQVSGLVSSPLAMVGGFPSLDGQAIASGLQSPIESSSQWVSDRLAVLVQGVQAVGQAIAQFFAQVYQSLVDHLPSLDQIQSTLQEGINFAIHEIAAGTLANTLASLLPTISRGTYFSVQKAMDRLAGSLLQGFVPGLTNSVGGALAGLVPYVTEAMEAIWLSLNGQVPAAIQNVLNFVRILLDYFYQVEAIAVVATTQILKLVTRLAIAQLPPDFLTSFTYLAVIGAGITRTLTGWMGRFIYLVGSILIVRDSIRIIHWFASRLLTILSDLNLPTLGLEPVIANLQAIDHWISTGEQRIQLWIFERLQAFWGALRGGMSGVSITGLNLMGLMPDYSTLQVGFMAMIDRIRDRIIQVIHLLASLPATGLARGQQLTTNLWQQLQGIPELANQTAQSFIRQFTSQLEALGGGAIAASLFSLLLPIGGATTRAILKIVPALMVALTTSGVFEWIHTQIATGYAHAVMALFGQVQADGSMLVVEPAWLIRLGEIAAWLNHAFGQLGQTFQNLQDWLSIPFLPLVEVIALFAPLTTGVDQITTRFRSLGWQGVVTQLHLQGVMKLLLRLVPLFQRFSQIMTQWGQQLGTLLAPLLAALQKIPFVNTVLQLAAAQLLGLLANPLLIRLIKGISGVGMGAIATATLVKDRAKPVLNRAGSDMQQVIALMRWIGVGVYQMSKPVITAIPKIPGLLGLLLSFGFKLPSLLIGPLAPLTKLSTLKGAGRITPIDLIARFLPDLLVPATEKAAIKGKVSGLISQDPRLADLPMMAKGELVAKIYKAMPLLSPSGVLGLSPLIAVIEGLGGALIALGVVIGGVYLFQPQWVKDIAFALGGVTYTLKGLGYILAELAAVIFPNVAHGYQSFSDALLGTPVWAKAIAGAIRQTIAVIKAAGRLYVRIIDMAFKIPSQLVFGAILGTFVLMPAYILESVGQVITSVLRRVEQFSYDLGAAIALGATSGDWSALVDLILVPLKDAAIAGISAIGRGLGWILWTMIVKVPMQIVNGLIKVFTWIILKPIEATAHFIGNLIWGLFHPVKTLGDASAAVANGVGAIANHLPSIGDAVNNIGDLGTEIATTARTTSDATIQAFHGLQGFGVSLGIFFMRVSDQIGAAIAAIQHPLDSIHQLIVSVTAFIADPPTLNPFQWIADGISVVMDALKVRIFGIIGLLFVFQLFAKRTFFGAIAGTFKQLFSFVSLGIKALLKLNGTFFTLGKSSRKWSKTLRGEHQLYLAGNMAGKAGRGALRIATLGRFGKERAPNKAEQLRAQQADQTHRVLAFQAEIRKMQRDARKDLESAYLNAPDTLKADLMKQGKVKNVQGRFGIPKTVLTEAGQKEIAAIVSREYERGQRGFSDEKILEAMGRAKLNPQDFEETFGGKLIPELRKLGAGNPATTAGYQDIQHVNMALVRDASLQVDTLHVNANVVDLNAARTAKTKGEQRLTSRHQLDAIELTANDLAPVLKHLAKDKNYKVEDSAIAKALAKNGTLRLGTLGLPELAEIHSFLTQGDLSEARSVFKDDWKVNKIDPTGEYSQPALSFELLSALGKVKHAGKPLQAEAGSMTMETAQNLQTAILHWKPEADKLSMMAHDLNELDASSELYKKGKAAYFEAQKHLARQLTRDFDYISEELAIKLMSDMQQFVMESDGVVLSHPPGRADKELPNVVRQLMKAQLDYYLNLDTVIVGLDSQVSQAAKATATDVNTANTSTVEQISNAAESIQQSSQKLTRFQRLRQSIQSWVGSIKLWTTDTANQIVKSVNELKFVKQKKAQVAAILQSREDAKKQAIENQRAEARKAAWAKQRGSTPTSKMVAELGIAGTPQQSALRQLEEAYWNRGTDAFTSKLLQTKITENAIPLLRQEHPKQMAAVLAAAKAERDKEGPAKFNSARLNDAQLMASFLNQAKRKSENRGTSLNANLRASGIPTDGPNFSLYEKALTANPQIHKDITALRKGTTFKRLSEGLRTALTDYEMKSGVSAELMINSLQGKTDMQIARFLREIGAISGLETAEKQAQLLNDSKIPAADHLLMKDPRAKIFMEMMKTGVIPKGKDQAEQLLIKEVLTAIARSQDTEVDHIIDPNLRPEDLKRAKALRIAKVKQLTGTEDLSAFSEKHQINPAVMGQVLAGKSYLASEAQLTQLAHALQFASVAAMEESLSSLNLLAAAQKKGVKQQVAQLATKAFRLTGVPQLWENYEYANQLLIGQSHLATKRRRKAQGDAVLEDIGRQARDRGAQAARRKAGITDARWSQDLNDSGLRELYENLIKTGELKVGATADEMASVRKFLGMKDDNPQGLTKRLNAITGQYTDKKTNRTINIGKELLAYLESGKITDKQIEEVLNHALKKADLGHKSLADFRKAAQSGDISGFIEEYLRTGEFMRNAYDQEVAELSKIMHVQPVDLTRLEKVATDLAPTTRWERLRMGIKMLYIETAENATQLVEGIRNTLLRIPFLTPLVKRMDEAFATASKHVKHQGGKIWKRGQALNTQITQAWKNSLPVQLFSDAKIQQSKAELNSLPYLMKQAGVGSLKDLQGRFSQELTAQGAGHTPEQIDEWFSAILNVDPKQGLKGQVHKDAIAALQTILDVTEGRMKVLAAPGGLSAQAVAPLQVFLLRKVPILIRKSMLGLAKQLGKRTQRAFLFGLRRFNPVWTRNVGQFASRIGLKLSLAVNRIQEKALPGFKPLLRLENAVFYRGKQVEGFFNKQAKVAEDWQQGQPPPLPIRQRLVALFTAIQTGVMSFLSAVRTQVEKVKQKVVGSGLFGAIAKFAKGVFRGIATAVTTATQSIIAAPGQAVKASRQMVSGGMQGRYRRMGGLREIDAEDTPHRATFDPDTKRWTQEFDASKAAPTTDQRLLHVVNPAIANPALTPSGGTPTPLQTQQKPKRAAALYPDPWADPPVSISEGFWQGVRKLIPTVQPKMTEAVRTIADPSHPEGRSSQTVQSQGIFNRLTHHLSTKLQQFSDHKATQAKESAAQSREAAFTRLEPPVMKQVRQEQASIDSLSQNQNTLPPIQATPALPPAPGTTPAPLPQDLKPPIPRATAPELQINLLKGLNPQRRLVASMRLAAKQVTKAWHGSTQRIQGLWFALPPIAQQAAAQIVQWLNHGASDVTAEAWQHAEGEVANSMDQMATHAASTADQITEATTGAAHDLVVANTHAVTKSVGVLGRLRDTFKSLRGDANLFSSAMGAGMKVGGAVMASGMAMQTLSWSLSTIGVLDEESTQAITKFSELFSIVGAVGGIVTPVIGAIASIFGVVVSVGATLGAVVFSPIGLAIAGIGLAIVALNVGISKLFGVDILAGIVQRLKDHLAAPIGAAVDWIQEKWQGFVTKFAPILTPIVEPAVKVGQKLVSSLAENSPGPTFLIRQHWDKAIGTIQAQMGELPATAESSGKGVLDGLGSTLNGFDMGQLGDPGQLVNKMKIPPEHVKTLLEGYGVKSTGDTTLDQMAIAKYMAKASNGVKSKIFDAGLISQGFTAAQLKAMNELVDALKDPIERLADEMARLKLTAMEFRLVLAVMALSKIPGGLIEQHQKIQLNNAELAKVGATSVADPARLTLSDRLRAQPKPTPQLSLAQQAIANTQQGIRDLQQQLQAIGPMLTTFALTNPFVPIGAAIAGVIALLELLTPQFNVLGALAGAIVAPFAMLYGIVRGIAEALGLVEEFQGLVTEIKAIGAAIWRVITPMNYLQDVQQTFTAMTEQSILFGIAIGKHVGGVVVAIAQTMQRAVTQITRAWMGFVLWFLQMPLVGTAIAMAQGLIAALNCHPTEVIPMAWEGAIARIKEQFLGWLDSGSWLAEQLKSVFNPDQLFGGITEFFNTFQLPAWATKLLGDRKPAQPQAAPAELAPVKLDQKEVLRRAMHLATMAQGGNRAADAFAFKLMETKGQLAPQQVADLMTSPTTGAFMQQAQTQINQQVFHGAGLDKTVATADYQKAMAAVDQAEQAAIAKNAARPKRKALSAQAQAIEQDNFAFQREQLTTTFQRDYGRVQLSTGQADFARAIGYDPAGVERVGSQVLNQVDTMTTAIQDRMDILSYGADPAALFAPGMDRVSNNLAILESDFANFGERAWTALTKLDFAALGQAAQDFGGNFVYAAIEVAKGFGDMSLSAIAFGAFSLLSLSPVTMILAGIGVAIAALAFNFLGLRTIAHGISKIVVGTFQVIASTVRGVLQMVQGVVRIIQGLFLALTGDFSQLQAGFADVFQGLQTIAQGWATGFRNIFSGVKLVVTGILQGITQVWRVFAGSLKASIDYIKRLFASFRRGIEILGNALIAVVTRPHEVWAQFLAVLEKVASAITGAKDAIADATVGKLGKAKDAMLNSVANSPVGRATKAVKLRVTGQAESMTSAQAMVDFDQRLQQSPPAAVTTPPPEANPPKSFAQMSWAERVAASTPPESSTRTPADVLADTRDVATTVTGLIGMVAPAVSAPLMGIIALADSFGAIAGLIPTLTAGFTALTAGGTTIAAIFSTITGVASAAMAAISIPLLPIIAAIAGAIAVVALFRHAWEIDFMGIRDIVHSTWRSFKHGLVWILGVIRQGVGTLVGWIMQGLQVVLTPVQIVLMFIGEMITQISEIGRDVFGTLFTELGNIWNAIAAIGAVILAPFQPLLAIFGGGGGGLRGLIHQTVAAILLPLKLVAFVVTTMIRNVSLIIQSVLWLGKLLVTAILAPFTLIKNILWVAFVLPIQWAWSTLQAIGNFILTLPQKVAGMLGSVLQQIPFFGAVFSSQTGETAPVKMATGGWVTGAGTGTSDSIPAMLSNGEFVVPARAAAMNAHLLQSMQSGADLESALQVAATPAPIPVSAPTFAPSSAPTELPPITINMTFGDIVLTQANSPDQAEEFLNSIEPILQQKVREMLRNLVEMMK